MTSMEPEKRNIENYTIAFHTLGCKVNRYETDAVRQAFASLGFQIVTEETPADILVINTCTVTSEADRKSRQMIRRAKRRNPGAIVVAMGCQIELLKSASDADITVGTKNRLSVVDLVLEKMGLPMADPPSTVIKTPSTVIKTPETGYQEFGPVVSQEDTTRAFVKIQDGCDSFCSYCIIPFARGRVVSRASAEILREAEELSNRGFHEIVLTGIHLCSFGKERGEGIEALVRLLEQIDDIPSIHRIRLGSLEPNSMTESFVHRLAGIRKLCPHFHVSLQSGSDSVLSRMNRKYTTKGYREVISQLRSVFPRVAVTTDIIVAFPGETEEEHQESLRFCREIGFSRIHVFPFSVRNGTRAADMQPKVSSKTAAERTDTFIQLSNSLAAAYCSRFEGDTVDVLLETKDESGEFSGYSKEYLRVHVSSGQDVRQGQEVRVKVISTEQNELYGTVTY